MADGQFCFKIQYTHISCFIHYIYHTLFRWYITTHFDLYIFIYTHHLTTQTHKAHTMSYHIISSRVCFSDLSSNPFFFAFPRFDIRELKLEDVNGASWSHRVAGGASSNLLAPNKRGLVNPFFWIQPKDFGWFCWVEFSTSGNRFCFFKDFLQDSNKKWPPPSFPLRLEGPCHEAKNRFEFLEMVLCSRNSVGETTRPVNFGRKPFSWGWWSPPNGWCF